MEDFATSVTTLYYGDGFSFTTKNIAGRSATLNHTRRCDEDSFSGTTINYDVTFDFNGTNVDIDFWTEAWGTNPTNTTYAKWQVTNWTSDYYGGGAQTSQGFINTGDYSKQNYSITVDAHGEYTIELTLSSKCYSETHEIVVNVPCGVNPLTLDIARTPTDAILVHGQGDAVLRFPRVEVFNDADYDLDFVDDWSWTIIEAPEASMFYPHEFVEEEETMNVLLNTSFAINDTHSEWITNWTMDYDQVKKVRGMVLHDCDETRKLRGCFIPDVEGDWKLELTVTDVCMNEFKDNLTFTTQCDASPSIQFDTDFTRYYNSLADEFPYIKMQPLIANTSKNHEQCFFWEWVRYVHPNGTEMEDYSPPTLLGETFKTATFRPSDLGSYTWRLTVSDTCSVTTKEVTYEVLCDSVPPATWTTEERVDVDDRNNALELLYFHHPARPGCDKELYWSLKSWTPPEFRPYTATSTPTPTTEPTSSSLGQVDESEQDNTWIGSMLAGIIGGLLGVVLIAVIIYLVVKHMKKKNKIDADGDSSSDSDSA